MEAIQGKGDILTGANQYEPVARSCRHDNEPSILGDGSCPWCTVQLGGGEVGITVTSRAAWNNLGNAL
jgi:hypothetical protein